MDLTKFTERSRGFIQAAQTIATRDSHQRLTPEHVLKALLDDDQGLASNLITASGGDAARVRQALDVALGKMLESDCSEAVNGVTRETLQTSATTKAPTTPDQPKI